MDDNIIAGMDIGTTFSAAAMVINGRFESPQDIRNRSMHTVVPSIFHINSDKNVIIGESARKYIKKDPTHTYLDTKRCIGVPLSKYL